jgi:hypothetical protein
VRALLVPFDVQLDSQHSAAQLPQAVISAGTDRRIRYWSTGDSSLSYAVFDQEFGIQPTQYWDNIGKVAVCREDLQQHKDAAPAAEGRGLPHPSFNHEDAVLDLAFVGTAYAAFQSGSAHKNPGFLLSASRDGVVKAWV